METEVTKLKEDLLRAQNALNEQTRRCRWLVGEFTRRLQQKEYQYEYEKYLRDDQLANALRALLLIEAKLKQEQKLITHQLMEKDSLIQKQSNVLKKLLSIEYCKNCSRLYNSNNKVDSVGSSSEYILTDYQESNLGSLDSSSELYYGAMSDNESNSYNMNTNESGSNKNDSFECKSPQFKKNRTSDSLDRKIRKFPHRKSVGTYFEVLKLHNDNGSPFSNEDDTSNDYDNLDSLPPESSLDQISMISAESTNSFDNEPIENNYNVVSTADQHDFDLTNNVSLSESNITVIHNVKTPKESIPKEEGVNENSEEVCDSNYVERKLSDTISVFDVEAESNEKWYVSASDQEDEHQKNIYRNNPVLECVNQILLQNISDSLNSPPKSPNVERKLTKTKKVKFNDEEIVKSEDQALTQANLDENQKSNHDYYETPIQIVPNFYETPQSVYSNDYEQILNRCGVTFRFVSNEVLEKKEEKDIHKHENKTIFRRNKISRTPPALPPKPDNLVSKYKIQCDSLKLLDEKSNDATSLDSEPDYCSISELNLPTNRTFKKIQAVAEINEPASRDSIKNIGKSAETPNIEYVYNQYNSGTDGSNDMILKSIDAIDIQIARQTTICSEDTTSTPKSPVKYCQEIPKLPLVTEIIIPEELENEADKLINQDNYVKNNSQMLKTKNTTPKRRPISIGSSVSSLIMGFNDRELMYELNENKSTKSNPSKQIFSSSDNLQNGNKQNSPKIELSQNHEEFNLSQNFEEFKLDDCEIAEFAIHMPDSEENNLKEKKLKQSCNSGQRMETMKNMKDMIKSVNMTYIPTLNKKSLELFKQQLQKQQNENERLVENERICKRNNEPTYEHFLECTGLSSKSILTPPKILNNREIGSIPEDVIRSSEKNNENNFGRSNLRRFKYWPESFM